MVAKKLKIKLVRSTIGCQEKQKNTIKSLGLRKIRQIVEHDDTPQIQGMIKKVNHLVEVEEA